MARPPLPAAVGARLLACAASARSQSAGRAPTPRAKPGSSPPPAAPAPSPTAGSTVAVHSAVADSAGTVLVASYVRGHDQELRFCYQEHGLKTNPDLAGAVTLMLELAPEGNVARAYLAAWDWNGPEGEGVESCILQHVRGWRFPLEAASARGPHQFLYRFGRDDGT